MHYQLRTLSDCDVCAHYFHIRQQASVMDVSSVQCLYNKLNRHNVKAYGDVAVKHHSLSTCPFYLQPDSSYVLAIATR